MNTIKNYLDKMFEGLENTPKINDAKQELLSMMEDKYNELINSGLNENQVIGKIISEFGDLNEISDILGIEEEIKNKEIINNLDDNYVLEYLNSSSESANKISLGVFLCIFSSVTLMFLRFIKKVNIINLDDNIINIIGFSVMMLLIAIAVAIFIMNGIKLGKYEHIEKSSFNISYDSKKYANQFKENLNFARIIAISVALIIISIIPIMIFDNILEYKHFNSLGVVIFLTVISISVKQIVSISIKYSAAQKILQEGDYSTEKKLLNNKLEKFSSIYWGFIVIIYLLSSFILKKWSITWIIWPVAGILWGIIESVWKS